MPDSTIAMRALERAITSMPQSRHWRALVAGRIESLRVAYLREVERGMAAHDAALDATPWISGRLQLLRRDQARIVDELETLKHAGAATLDVETLRQQAYATLQQIVRLRQRENDLIYESVDLDLGGEQ